MTEVVAFPSITIVCYMIGKFLKNVENEKLDRFIPSICGLSGAILGVVMFLVIPDFIPAENWAVAIEIGIVSGFTATGINQVYKQFKEALG